MPLSLKGFQSVFGEAKAELETAALHALLPFLFLVQAGDGRRLQVQITDFHSNTWQAIKTADQLEELRDEVGISGSLEEFVSYLGDSFSSDNVRLILGGPASSVGGYGATSAKVTVQKSKGLPRVSIWLEKLTDPLASDAMGNISVELFRAFKQKSDTLVAVEGRLSQMTATSTIEKENTEKLQKQLDAYSFGNKKRGRKVTSSQSRNSPTLDMSFQSQLDSKMFPQTQLPPVPEESQSHVSDKPSTSRSKVRAAPASRRAKQRGARLADNED